MAGREWVSDHLRAWVSSVEMGWGVRHPQWASNRRVCERLSALGYVPELGWGAILSSENNESKDVLFVHRQPGARPAEE